MLPFISGGTYGGFHIYQAVLMEASINILGGTSWRLPYISGGTYGGFHYWAALMEASIYIRQYFIEASIYIY